MTTIFRFKGFGNYSGHGWDNGLSFSFDSVITEEQMKSWEDVDCKVPTIENPIEVIFSNSYGGSRNVDIAVLAQSFDDAELMANQWAFDNYPVEEYEG